MKKCELCDSVAQMYCDSDEAVLCWECDVKVHSANFLVSKHRRTLLCKICQSLTPWTGSGARLGPTVSVCDSCIQRRENHNRAIDQVVPVCLFSSSSTTTQHSLGGGKQTHPNY